MKKSEVKSELKRILDRIDYIQINYEVYSEKADDLLTEASDKIEHAFEVL